MWDTLKNTRFSFFPTARRRKTVCLSLIQQCPEPLAWTALAPAPAPTPTSILLSFILHISQYLEPQHLLYHGTFACVEPSAKLPFQFSQWLMGVILPASGKAPFPSGHMAYSFQVVLNGLFWNQGTPSIPDLSLLCQNMLCCCKLCSQWWAAVCSSAHWCHMSLSIVYSKVAECMVTTRWVIWELSTLLVELVVQQSHS